MPVLDHIILADGAVQRPDGKMDIFGAGLDTVYAHTVPALHPQLAVVVRAGLSREELERPQVLDVVVSDPSESEIARAHAELLPLPDSPARAGVSFGDLVPIGVVVAFSNLVFPAYGTYNVAALWNGEPLRPPFQLTVSQTPPLQPPAQDRDG
jgi:hypothetical protein